MTTDMQCPRCHTALALTETCGIHVEACPACGGLWFDANEMARLAKGHPGALAGLEARYNPAPGAAPPPEMLGGRLCPVCRVHMNEFEFPWAAGVRLDGCPGCRGIWADDGELSRIEAAVHRHRSLAAAPRRVDSRVGSLQSLISGDAGRA